MLSRSPFSRRGYEGVYQPSITDSDISFVSSGRPSVDQMFPSLYDDVDVPRLSVTSEYGENRLSFATTYSKQSIDLGSPYAPNSSTSFESGRQSFSLQGQVFYYSKTRYVHMRNVFFICLILKSDRMSLKPR